MKRSSYIRLYGITVSGTCTFYGDCTITKDKRSKPTFTIQIDDDFIEDINPNKVPLYTTSDGLFTHIPYEENYDVKYETARRYVKMWTAVTLYAIQNNVNPKSLFSLVLYCTKNREDSPEVILKRWEKDNGKIDFPDVLELVEKAQEYLPENKVHDWIKEKSKMYVSVQPYY